MYEPQFLRDMAEQNYANYNISYKSSRFHKTGLMLTINSSRSVPFAVNQFFKIFSSELSFVTEKNISLPNWDASIGGKISYNIVTNIFLNIHLCRFNCFIYEGSFNGKSFFSAWS